MPARRDRYPDDIFADSRMPLEDHLGELASRLRLALAGVVLVALGGVVLDLVATSTGQPGVGFAFPVLRMITAPAEREVEAFYLRRYDEVTAKLRADPGAGGPREPLALGLPAPPGGRAEVAADVDPAELARVARLGEMRAGLRRPLTTLSAPEAMVTYFKVALALALVVASPWVFYQGWAFVAAGLYPHERRRVYAVLPASLALFLAGVVLCQLVVTPSAVRALLAFNAWTGYDPDLRLREWMGFAVALPLVFGFSFQTPVVMAFFTRIGVTTARGYLTYWRHAALGAAAFAAVITPTADAVTWAYLFVPVFGLYLVGAGVCRLVEPLRRPDELACDV